MKKEYVYIQKYVSKANPLYLILPAFVFLSLILKRLSSVNTTFLKGNTFTIIIILAVAIYLLLEVRTKSMLKKLDKVIIIDNEVLIFSTVESFRAVHHEIKLSDIADCFDISNGNEFKIKMKNGRSYKFFGEFFESPELLRDFIELVKSALK